MNNNKDKSIIRKQRKKTESGSSLHEVHATYLKHRWIYSNRLTLSTDKENDSKFFLEHSQIPLIIRNVKKKEKKNTISIANHTVDLNNSM